MNKVTDIKNPGVVPNLVLFNKLSGTHFSTSTVIDGNPERNIAKLNTEYLDYKVVEFDPAIQMWYGDKSTGGVIEIEKAKLVVPESESDAVAKAKVLKMYPVYLQLRTQQRMLRTLMEVVGADKLDGDFVSDFEEMEEYIQHIVANNTRYKSEAKANPDVDYLSRKDEAVLLDMKNDGGLHEMKGRPMQLEVDAV